MIHNLSTLYSVSSFLPTDTNTRSFDFCLVCLGIPHTEHPYQFLLFPSLLGGGGEAEGGGAGSTVFELLVRGGMGRTIFRYPWGWVIVLYNRNGTHLTQTSTDLTPSGSNGRKCYEYWLKKYTWLVYNRDGNFMYCKICIKAKTSNGMSKEPKGINFQILHSFDMHVHRSGSSHSWA